MTVTAGDTAERTETGERFLGLSALDRLTLLYVLAASVLLAAHVANWRNARPTRWETECLIASHVLALAFALLAPVVRDRSRSEDSFVAEWYPVMVMADENTSPAGFTRPYLRTCLTLILWLI